MPLIKHKNKSAQWHKLIDEFNHFFVEVQICTFTNLMWQLIVNEANAELNICYHPTDATEEDNAFGNEEGSTPGFKIVLIEDGKPGFRDMGVLFLPDMDYMECCAVCDDLNFKLFGLKEEAEKMVSDSMVASINQNTVTDEPL